MQPCGCASTDVGCPLVARAKRARVRSPFAEANGCTPGPLTGAWSRAHPRIPRTHSFPGNHSQGTSQSNQNPPRIARAAYVPTRAAVHGLGILDSAVTRYLRTRLPRDARDSWELLRIATHAPRCQEIPQCFAGALTTRERINVPAFTCAQQCPPDPLKIRIHTITHP